MEYMARTQVELTCETRDVISPDKAAALCIRKNRRQSLVSRKFLDNPEQEPRARLLIRNSSPFPTPLDNPCFNYPQSSNSFVRFFFF